MLLYVHRDRKGMGRGTQDGHLDFHAVPELEEFGWGGGREGGRGISSSTVSASGQPIVTNGVRVSAVSQYV